MGKSRATQKQVTPHGAQIFRDAWGVFNILLVAGVGMSFHAAPNIISLHVSSPALRDIFPNRHRRSFSGVPLREGQPHNVLPSPQGSLWVLCPPYTLQWRRSWYSGSYRLHS